MPHYNEATRIVFLNIVMNIADLIYNAIGQGDTLNNLRGEYLALPRTIQKKWLRKALKREFLLYLTGQKLLQRNRLPDGPIKMLWFYDSNPLGDSIMDLSQRFALPKDVTLDAYIPNGPAALFDSDTRFNRIYTDLKAVPRNYDFLLIHSISSTSLGTKLLHFFGTPWAATMNHQQGEQYSRVHFTAARFGQLMGKALAPIRPRLPVPEGTTSEQRNIVIALGGEDMRRRYQFWPEVLTHIAEQLGPAQTPRFTLIGSGTPAKEDLARFSPAFLEAHTDIAFDLPNLTTLKSMVANCGYFMGCDSGLMHLAEAYDKPGIALFGNIRHEWRLLPESRLIGLFDAETVNNLSPADIAARFLAVYDSSTHS